VRDATQDNLDKLDDDDDDYDSTAASAADFDTGRAHLGRPVANKQSKYRAAYIPT
jgi:hypothetical protein